MKEAERGDKKKEDIDVSRLNSRCPKRKYRVKDTSFKRLYNIPELGLKASNTERHEKGSTYRDPPVTKTLRPLSEYGIS
jgi:hypothetical protein